MKFQNRMKKGIAVLLSGVMVFSLAAGSFSGNTMQVRAMDLTGPDTVAFATEEQSSENTVDVHAGGKDIAVQDAGSGEIAVQGFGGLPNSSHSLCNDENCSDETHKLPEGASWTGVSELSDDMAAGYYYLTADVTLTAGWTPADGVVLCLNGKSITVDEDGEAVIYVEIARNVTICNCADSGTITHSKQEDGTTPKRGSGVCIKGGTLNLYGGTISGNYVDSDGAGVNMSDGTFNLYGGTISGNEAFHNGGGVYMEKETCAFNLYGGSVSGNTADKGGGVYVASGTFNMNDGTISNNKASGKNSNNGGGIYITGTGSTFTMSGGIISGNDFEDNVNGRGGGVYMNDGSTFTMSGNTKISGNTAAYGSAVYMDNLGSSVVFTMSGGTISGNVCTGSGGGAVYACAGSTFNVSDNVKIIGNTIENNLTSGEAADAFIDGITEQYFGATGYRYSIINIVGELGEDAEIGVAICNGRIYADRKNYVVKFADTLTDPAVQASCLKKFVPNGNSYHKTEDLQFAYETLSDGNTYAWMREKVHEHYLCGDEDAYACTGVGGHTCDKTTFTKWTSATDLPTSGTYYLTQDVTVSAQVELTGDLTLCLNGHSILSEYNESIGGAIKVNDSTHTLTLTDCNGSNSTHTFKKNANNGNRWEPDTDGTGTITVTGGVITHSQGMRGAGIWVENGNLVMYGGTICGNQTSCGGAGVHAGYGSFTMYGGAICGNYGSGTMDFGGGVLICTDTGSFTMYGGEISENTAIRGGGVGNDHSTFTMNGGKICNNTATESGGGIYSESVSEKTIINDGEISGNTATNGGGVYSCYGFTMNDGEISGNTADNGGGVYVKSGSFTMAGGRMNGNKATGDKGSGGIYNDGTVTMKDDALLSGNTGYYGGVYVGYNGKLIMSGGTITGNNGTGGAGGVYIYAMENSRKMIVSGAAKIYDNWNSGSANNLYIREVSNSNLPSLIVIEGAMTIGDDGAKIGVEKGALPTKDNPIKVAVDDTSYTITDNDAKAFFADAGDEYCIMKEEDGALYLEVKPHEHNWSYTAKDDTITATCSAEGCDVVTTSLKIVPPDSSTLTYDGTEKEATLAYTDFITATGLDVPIIEYQEGTGPNNTLPYGSLPTNAGTYTAGVSVENADNSYTTASVTFEIKKADLRADDFTFKAPDDLIYSGTVKNAVVTSGKVDNGITVKYYNENGQAVDEVKNAGTYTVKIDVAESLNYNAASNLTEDSWKFTINPAIITVTPDAVQQKTYGDSDPALEYTFSGAVNGETPAFDGALSKGSVENAGEYDIVIGSLKLVDRAAFIAGNYQLVLNSTPVKFTITQKSVTITGFKAENKIYDGTTDATVIGTPVLEGLVSGDENSVTVDGSSVTAKFEDKNVGTGKHVAADGYRLDGTGAGNYSLTNPTIALTADISPKELTIHRNSVVVINRKTYDGQISADVSNVTLGGCVANESLVLDRDYTATAAFDTAAVGVDKDITVTVELYNSTKARNYTFAEGANKCTVTGGEIEKAAVNNPAAVELVVISGATKTYKVALPELPALEAPREYGKCEYIVNEPDLKYGYAGTASISRDGTELMLDMLGAGSNLGAVGTIKVTVRTDNYEDITLTVNVRATDKTIPQLEGGVTLSPAEITYGDALSGITITGKMTDGNHISVPGKFEWQSPTDVLPVGTHNDVAWKFTPDDDQIYEEATGVATVIVNKVVQSGTVSMTSYTYNDTPSQPVLHDRVGDQNATVIYYYSTDNTNSGGMEWKDIKPATLHAGIYYIYAVIAETANYSGYTTPAVKFEVRKVVSTGEPKYTKITTEGKTLADANLTLTGSTLSPAAGTLEWIDEAGNVLSGDTKVAANKIYKWRFTPADNNFDVLTGEIELYHVDMPVISAQPKNVSVKAGESAVFEVTAKGTALTYQWQIDRNDGKGFVDLNGANSAVYTSGETSEACNGFKYRCVIRNAAGAVTSDTVALTVEAADKSIAYKITEGANSSWTQNVDGSLTFRGTGDFAKFVKLLVDGKEVDSENYTVTEGSTIITLKQGFLESLSKGRHTLKIVWTDGSASTHFTVAENTSDADDSDKKTDSNKKTDRDQNAGGTDKKTSGSAPSTGDPSQDALWLILMLSFAGLAGTLAIRKKE